MPLVIAAAVAARRSSRRGTLVAAAGFGFFLIVPSLLYGVADARRNESFSAFVPLGVALLCLVALWPQRAERAALAPTVPERAAPLATPLSAR